MKTTRTFKGSWFLLAVVAGVVACEIAAWELATLSGVRISPITAAFVGAGIVAVFASVIYDGIDVD
jgi:uncharacterized membrane protein YeaQ/YmgE (transglycosylase-associated protein family)